ncbi:MAG: polyprenyl diphosphate synthase [Patescibacteria group bacterium]
MEGKNVLKHVALIPDGNRRWAKKRGFKPWVGHGAGAKILEGILQKTLEFKIPYFTFWGGSLDNLTKRPKLEVDFLVKLYSDQFERILRDKRIHQNKVKINVFGRWQEVIPQKVKKTIQRAIDATKSYDKNFLNFLIAYDGKDEMMNCISEIVKISKEKPVKITEDLVKKNLWTKDLPPVDIVIRTGCNNDPHMSAGFMMWDTAYTQYYFTKTFFPSFDSKEFEKIIIDYLERERRMGK